MLGRQARTLSRQGSDDSLIELRVCYQQCGPCLCVCSLLLEDGENPSLADLRLRIQEGREGGMIKRTVMFEEALCTMRFAANPYNWPEDQRFKYRLGILEEVSERTLLGQEEEQAGADQIQRCWLLAASCRMRRCQCCCRKRTSGGRCTR